MVDLATITSVVSALKGAAEVVKSVKELSSGIKNPENLSIREKVSDLAQAIFEARANALEAQSEQQILLNRVRQLDEELGRAQAWGQQKERYTLNEVYPGSFVYTLKEGSKGDEPVHHLCAACFSNEKMMILQQADSEFLKCPTCGTRVQFRKSEKIVAVVARRSSIDWGGY